MSASSPALLLLACNSDTKLKNETPNPLEVNDQNVADMIYTVWDFVQNDFQGKFGSNSLDRNTADHIKKSGRVVTVPHVRAGVDRAIDWGPVNVYPGDFAGYLRNSLDYRPFLEYDKNNCLLSRGAEGKFDLKNTPEIKSYFHEEDGALRIAVEDIEESTKRIFKVPSDVHTVPLGLYGTHADEERIDTYAFRSNSGPHDFWLYLDVKGHFFFYQVLSKCIPINKNPPGL